MATYRNNRWLLKEVRIARDIDKRPDGTPGRVWVTTAVWLHAAPEGWLDPNAGVGFYGEAYTQESLNLADGVQRLAEERARVSWALAHPMGAGQTPLDLLKARLTQRRMVREARERARTVPTPVPTSPPEKPD